MKTHIASLLAIFLNFGSALALEAPQLKDPMTVVIVRSADPHCEPNCPEWISAEGQFAPGVDAAFAGALRAMGNRRLPIFFNSPGGSLEVAIRIGHMVRDRQLDVAVSKTIFDGCGPKDKNCAVQKVFPAIVAGLMRAAPFAPPPAYLRLLEALTVTSATCPVLASTNSS